MQSSPRTPQSSLQNFPNSPFYLHPTGPTTTKSSHNPTNPCAIPNPHTIPSQLLNERAGVNRTRAATRHVRRKIAPGLQSTTCGGGTNRNRSASFFSKQAGNHFGQTLKHAKNFHPPLPIHSTNKPNQDGASPISCINCARIALGSAIPPWPTCAPRQQRKHTILSILWIQSPYLIHPKKHD